MFGITSTSHDIVLILLMYSILLCLVLCNLFVLYLPCTSTALTLSSVVEVHVSSMLWPSYIWDQVTVCSYSLVFLTPHVKSLFNFLCVSIALVSVSSGFPLNVMCDHYFHFVLLLFLVLMYLVYLLYKACRPVFFSYFVLLSLFHQVLTSCHHSSALFAWFFWIIQHLELGSRVYVCVRFVMWCNTIDSRVGKKFKYWLVYC